MTRSDNSILKSEANSPIAVRDHRHIFAEQKFLHNVKQIHHARPIICAVNPSFPCGNTAPAQSLFFLKRHTKLHDKAERDRKRGDGDFRHRRIAEPSLAIRIHFPEDPAEEEGAGTSSGMGGRGGTGATNVDDEKKSWGDGIEVDGANAGEMEPDGDGDGEVDAWSLVAEEVGMAVFRLVSTLAAKMNSVCVRVLDMNLDPSENLVPLFAVSFTGSLWRTSD